MQRVGASAGHSNSEAERLSVTSGRQGWMVMSNSIGHRVSALTAQLLRAENQDVIELVAAELQESIRHYVESVPFRIADSAPLLNRPTLRLQK